MSSSQVLEDLISKVKLHFSDEEKHLFEEIVELGEDESVAASFVVDGGKSVDVFMANVALNEDKFNVNQKKLVKWAISRMKQKKAEIKQSQGSLQGFSMTQRSQSVVDLSQDQGSSRGWQNSNLRRFGSSMDISSNQSSSNDHKLRKNPSTSNLVCDVPEKMRKMSSIIVIDDDDDSDVELVPAPMVVKVEDPQVKVEVKDEETEKLRRHRKFIEFQGAVRVTGINDIYCENDANQRRIDATGALNAPASSFEADGRTLRSGFNDRVAAQVVRNNSASQASLGLDSADKKVWESLQHLGNVRPARQTKACFQNLYDDDSDDDDSTSQSRPAAVPKFQSSKQLHERNSRSQSQQDIRNFFGESSKSTCNAPGPSFRSSTTAGVSIRKPMNRPAKPAKSSTNPSKDKPRARIQDPAAVQVRLFDENEARALIEENLHWKKLAEEIRLELNRMMRTHINDNEYLYLRLAFYVNSKQKNMSKPGEEFDTYMGFPPGTLLRALININVCGVIGVLQKKLDQFTPEELLNNDFYAGVTCSVPGRALGHRITYVGMESIKLARTVTRACAIMLEFVCIGYLREKAAENKIKLCFNAYGGYDSPTSANLTDVYSDDKPSFVYLMFGPDSSIKPIKGEFRKTKAARELRTEGMMYSISTSEVLINTDKNVSSSMFNLGEDSLICKACQQKFATEAAFLLHQFMIHEKDTKSLKMRCMSCRFFTGSLFEVDEHMKSQHDFSLEQFAREVHEDMRDAGVACVEDSSQPMEIE